MHPTWRTHTVNTRDRAVDMIDRQWLLTNGTGAYAMGTLPGINTHRYHGLLIATQHPPVGRIAALNQVFDQLVLSTPERQHVVDLSTCRFNDDNGGPAYSPDGYQLLEQFEKGASVAWTYQVGSISIERRLLLHWKEQAATIRYTISGLEHPAVLRVAPMLTLRDFHGVTRRSDNRTFNTAENVELLQVTRDDQTVTFHFPGAQFVPAPPADQWWYDVRYPVDTVRGQSDVEDYFLPGRFEIALSPDEQGHMTVTVALGDKPATPELSTDARSGALIGALDHLGGSADPHKRMLVMAADDFVVDRTVEGSKLSTILAGYPWFADWGRDTFISLPGLLLTTGRFDEARHVLQAYALAIHGGLIPNRFDDYDDSADAAHYNTLDASLWFIHAAMEYLDATGDAESWNDWLANAAMTIIDAYIKGTSTSAAGDGIEIGVAGDGLVSAGSATTQLTWMDAACDGVVFTPRQGKAVEINALWYHALIGMSKRIAETHERQATHYKRLAARTKRGFTKVFWDDELGYLKDHVWIDDQNNELADQSLRPNQIFVASLPDSPMPRTKLKVIVAAIKQRLLTPFGLRTLPTDDRHYHGRYSGAQFDRDKAYHQGTVWPWLIGPYAEAVLRVGQFSDDARREARQAIDPLLEMLAGDGPFPTLGQLHEIHEGDAPHTPAGCMAQAWSIAEVLRVLRLTETGQA